LLKSPPYGRCVRLESRNSDPLGSCHGYIVVADDGWLGDVETPLFGSDSSEPDYLVVRAHSDGPARRSLVPVSLVRRVDVEDRLVHVRGNIWELARLPGTLPLVSGPPRSS
jgi:hypothetical protein